MSVAPSSESASASPAAPAPFDTAAPSPPRSAAREPVPVAPPGGPLSATDSKVPFEVQAAAEKAAAQALTAEKKNVFIPKCWQPALAKQPEPARAKYRFDLGFNAEGLEMARGISDDRSAPRYDVADCLRQLPIGMRIAAPGVPVHVLLTLEFP